MDFVFRGLSAAQRGVVMARFERLLVPAPAATASEVLPGADFRPAALSAFTPIPDTCWEYDLALDFQADRVDIAGPSFFARFTRGVCRAEVRTCLEDRFFLGVFENLFRVIAVYVLAQRDTLVIHSAGVAQAGEGYILFGRSGAGKTTSCELLTARTAQPGSPAHAILSDELNAVDLRAVAPGCCCNPCRSPATSATTPSARRRSRSGASTRWCRPPRPASPPALAPRPWPGWWPRAPS
ncbi:MAG: hypothetical protein IPG17_25225 [Sandaracinaceae bacterium]|nr:hypothetical protein [Sandaracinaceae bacterium]